MKNVLKKSTFLISLSLIGQVVSLKCCGKSLLKLSLLRVWKANDTGVLLTVLNLVLTSLSRGLIGRL